MKLDELLIGEQATILEAMKKLDKTGQRILFVAPAGILKAVLTDGDVRKCLLRGGHLTDAVSTAANYHPITLPCTERGQAKQLMEQRHIDALPILNKDGSIADLIFATGLNVDTRKRAGIPVVMMAGGLGTRLYPYTKILPKPLIPVGEQPISEMILDRFAEYGCLDAYMIVNYKKNMIRSYFDDLEGKPYHTRFVEENEFMGTGGGLCLMKGMLHDTFFFTNCDTLLDVDYGDVLEYHRSHKNLITMICAYKHFQVPYGVVEMGENGTILQQKEKPELNFLTNTGVYVVEPCVVEELNQGEKIGFPDVIGRYRAAGRPVGVYPIQEASWMDMGQIEEWEKMRRKLEGQV